MARADDHGRGERDHQDRVAQAPVGTIEEIEGVDCRDKHQQQDRSREYVHVGAIRGSPAGVAEDASGIARRPLPGSRGDGIADASWVVVRDLGPGPVHGVEGTETAGISFFDRRVGCHGLLQSSAGPVVKFKVVAVLVLDEAPRGGRHRGGRTRCRVHRRIPELRPPEGAFQERQRSVDLLLVSPTTENEAPR